MTTGLVMLLKKSIALEKKATGKILQLQGDKAKLCDEIDLLKEENAGWKKLHENSSSSMKMLQALVMKQKEELAKLCSQVLDAELRQLFLLFHGEGLQHLHRGTTILM